MEQARPKAAKPQGFKSVLCADAYEHYTIKSETIGFGAAYAAFYRQRR